MSIKALAKISCIAVLATQFASCGGGGSGGAMLPASSTSLAVAAYGSKLRYNPTALTESLSAPAMQFVYVDSDSNNGTFPSATQFLQQFSSANPAIVAGSCANIAMMSVAIIAPNAVSGVTAPTVVVSAYPIAKGSCSQALDLGSNGSASFTVAVGS